MSHPMEDDLARVRQLGAEALEAQLKALELARLGARRERIATAALQGLLAQPGAIVGKYLTYRAVELADALIAELDAEPKR